MPYGLINAPSMFQVFMSTFLQDMLDKQVIVYIYGIPIDSATVSEPIHHVHKVQI